MNQTDKDFIESKLRKAISLVYKDQTAQALREIADAVCVVAVRLESQTSGAHSMALTDFAGSQTGVAHQSHGMTGEVPAERDYSRGYSIEKAHEITERLALDKVKPLCPSGLLAGLSNGASYPQCPACGLFHDRRVVVVPLSLLGYEFVEADATLRIGFTFGGKFGKGDRIVFSDRNGKVGRGYVGDVIEIRDNGKGTGQEAITKVTTL